MMYEFFFNLSDLTNVFPILRNELRFWIKLLSIESHEQQILDGISKVVLLILCTKIMSY